MTIEQIRAALKDAIAEYNQCRDRALSLAAAQGGDMEELKTAQAALEMAQLRKQTLETELENETEVQSANLSAIRANGDAVKSAASRFKSGGDFLSCVARAAGNSRDMDPRLADYIQVRSSASGQNLTTDADGGYLVPPDYADELLNVAASESVLLPEVQRVPVSGNRLVVNILDQESRKDTVTTSGSEVKGRNGGLLAYWKAEAADYAASTMHFIQQTTELEKLTGLCYATDEMLEDLPALSAYIAQGFATGSNMPMGVLYKTVSAGNAALVTITKESGQADGSLVINNILKMWNAMPARNRANAKWYINQDLEILLYQLLMPTGSLSYTGKDSDAADVALSASFGMPIFVPAGGLASAPNGLLLGRPIVPVEQAPAVGSAGDISLLDLSQYRWIDKSAINAQTSIHVRFVQGEQAFRFTYRAGGRPIWPNAISAYTGSTSRSPYVALGARTT